MKLRYQLYKIRKESEPSKLFRRDLLNRLNSQIEPSKKVFILQNVWFRTVSITTATVLCFVSVGTAVYAYNSPDVTVGNPLYAVKRGIENIEEKTKITPEAKAKFYLKKVERREEEKKVIVQRVKAVVSASSTPVDLTVLPIQEIKQTEEAADEAVQQLSNLKNMLKNSGEDQALKTVIDNHLNRRSERRNKHSRFSDDLSDVTSTLNILGIVTSTTSTTSTPSDTSTPPLTVSSTQNLSTSTPSGSTSTMLNIDTSTAASSSAASSTKFQNRRNQKDQTRDKRNRHNQNRSDN